jgi:hypothetical protein
LEIKAMTSLSIATREELAEAAFVLLTSSTSSRYIRLAKRVALRSQLHARLKREPEMAAILVGHARTLWAQVLKAEQRDVFEIELALLLPVLAGTAEVGVEDLLLTLAVENRPVAAWISALARALLKERASNASRGDMAWSVTAPHGSEEGHDKNSAAGWVEEQQRAELYVTSPEAEVSQEIIPQVAA